MAFVVSLSLILAAYFFQENEKTRIEALAKSIVLEELNKENNFYFINEVEFIAPSTINICLRPSSPHLSDEVKMKGTISGITKIAVGNININYTDTQAC